MQYYSTPHNCTVLYRVVWGTVQYYSSHTPPLSLPNLTNYYQATLSKIVFCDVISFNLILHVILLFHHCYRSTYSCDAGNKLSSQTEVYAVLLSVSINCQLYMSVCFFGGERGQTPEYICFIYLDLFVFYVGLSVLYST